MCNSIFLFPQPYGVTNYVAICHFLSLNISSLILLMPISDIGSIGRSCSEQAEIDGSLLNSSGEKKN